MVKTFDYGMQCHYDVIILYYSFMYLVPCCTTVYVCVLLCMTCALFLEINQ